MSSKRVSKIIFLHGFLGSPEDWNEVIHALPSSYDCVAIDLTQTIPDCIDESCFVIGYSMGGRIALQLFPKHRLVLIGSHLGLHDEKERRERLAVEKEWIARLTEDPHKFIDEWYRQPLFSSFRQNRHLFERVLERRKSIDATAHASLISRFGLSNQIHQEPPKNALFLFGERDQKYATLYSNLTNARAVPGAGHAAHIENPKATAQLIQNYIEEKSC